MLVLFDVKRELIVGAFEADFLPNDIRGVEFASQETHLLAYTKTTGFVWEIDKSFVNAQN